MASDQKDAHTDDRPQQPTSVAVNDWNELVQHTEALSQGSGKSVKICIIDEEHEEIRLQNQDEFDLNVQYARDHGIPSLTFVAYLDDERVFNGTYHVEKPTEEMAFPADKLKMLWDNVLVEKWYIPVKQEEPLGVCLNAAIRLAQDGKLDANADCQRFIEDIVPEAFRKLQNTESVFSWPREIQCGIFEMNELLVDLVGIRLCYPPTPIKLLDTLAMTFDANTKFSQKHKNELLPARRTYTMKDGDFLREDYKRETFGWLRSILQRFLAQNGLKHVRLQFEYINASSSTTTAMEYNALLKLFSKCNQCINAQRFRLIFHRPIHQAIQYLRKQKDANEDCHQLKQLHETLMDICYKYELKDEINILIPLSDNPERYEMLPVLAESALETTPLIEVPLPVPRKTKSHDCYERLAEDIRSMNMSAGDAERKNIKKQRTDEQAPASLFTRLSTIECVEELLAPVDKRSLKRKHRREQQRSMLASMLPGHSNKKESKRSNLVNMSSNKSYDRSNPEDILRYFAPMKLKVATLYDNLHAATCNGNIRDVLKIEEKLKLLRPFSARFIADENTPDGTIMQPGQVFCKSWILLNDGSLPWDSNDVQLMNLSAGIEVLQQPIVPITAPHARATVAVEYKCADKAGKYESKWILAYRQQTFGPMIWCSIEVSEEPAATKSLQSVIDENDFEFVEVPLPACFDLSKPYQSVMQTSSISSLDSGFIMPRVDTSDLLSLDFSTVQLDNPQSPCDSDVLSMFTYSTPESAAEMNNPAPPTNASSQDTVSLIELAPPAVSENHSEGHHPARLNQSLDFVDTVVTNIFSVAKQAGSTAKAIFNTWQALDDPITEPPTLINTFVSNSTNSNGVFEHIDETPRACTDSFPTDDQMQTLIGMGFVNRAKNQRFLRENANDLAKVIELLTLDSNDDSDWFAHRH